MLGFSGDGSFSLRGILSMDLSIADARSPASHVTFLGRSGGVPHSDTYLVTGWRAHQESNLD